MRFNSFQEIGWIREWVSVIRIMIKYYISRLSNSFLICVFLEQSENISWQPSFNGRKYHLFYWKLFRLYLNEDILWGLGSGCHEVWFSCVEVTGITLQGNEPEWKSKYLDCRTSSRFIYIFVWKLLRHVFIVRDLFRNILYVWLYVIEVLHSINLF